MVQQKLVEISARDLVRAIGLGAKAVFEVKLYPVAAAGAVHFATEFVHEPGLGEFLMQAEPSESLHAEREKRFANVETWKLVTLDDQDAATRAREQGGSGAAGRS